MSDQSIDVPKFDQWPLWANSFQCYFSENTDPRAHGQLGFSGIQINRPAQAYSPNVGDIVFVKVNHDSVGIVIQDNGNATFTVRRTNGVEDLWAVDLIKPFNPSNIGKAWKDF